MRVLALVFAAAFAAALCIGLTQSINHDKIVSCYFGAWAFYRHNNSDQGQFDIDDIDASLCTHGYYGFARMNNVTWVVESIDPWYDLAESDCEPGYCKYDSYRRFAAIKEEYPHFHPMLSIGGWNEGSKMYSDMAKDPEKRAIFVGSLVPFCEKYGFAGIDLDWEYPGARDGDAVMDKQDFVYLSEEMGAALHAAGLLLTTAITPSPMTMDVGYDFPVLVQHYDFFNFMCYDYHGWFDGEHPFTGHNAPLFRREEEIYVDHPGFRFNVFDTITHALNRGVPKEKLVMGVPTFARGFHLQYGTGIPTYNGLYCPADDGVPMGPYTMQVGILGYNEILEIMNDPEISKDFTVVVDGCIQAPYAYSEEYWLGYDDEESIALKVKYANFLELGGIMVWSLDTDDFNGIHSDKPYPILRKVNEVLESGETHNAEIDNCESAPMCDIMSDQPILSTPTPGGGSSTTGHPTDPNGCSEHNDLVAFPGDCHKYLRCVLQDDGSFDTEVYDCGDWVFDPNTSSCVDPNLDGNENLCDDDFFTSH